MMFAQMPVPSGLEIGSWVACLGAVLWVLNQGNRLVKNFRGEPPSSDLKSAINELSVRIGALERCSEHDTTRRKEIYTKIEAVREGLSEQISQVHSRVDDLQKEMHEQIKNLPNELVVLLKNTGAIRPK